MEIYEIKTSIPWTELTFEKPEILPNKESQRLLKRHSALITALIEQKSRISEDLSGYKSVRDRMSGKSRNTRSRAGDKFEEIFHSTNLLKSDLKNFLDLCGAPGAFSVYLLENYPEAQGAGISLMSGIPWWGDLLTKYEDRFKLITGEEGTGDLYVKENREAVVSHFQQGCDLVVADGGFCVEGSEEVQELMTARLVLSEVIVALQSLTTSGNFVCKIFDTFSDLLGSIIFCLSQSFQKLLIVKPASSRDVNSERYIVGFGYKPCPAVIGHLERILELFTEDSSPETVLPWSVLSKDAVFVSSLNVMIREIAENQISSLRKVLDEREKKKRRRRA